MSSSKDTTFVLKPVVLTVGEFCMLMTVEIAIFKVLGLILRNGETYA